MSNEYKRLIVCFLHLKNPISYHCQDFIRTSKDLEELLGPKNKIGISGGTTDVWHLTDDKSQNFIRIVIIMVIVMIVLDDAHLCCWCGCFFSFMVDCLWRMFSSFVVSSSVTPQCLTSLGRLAHHLVDVKQSNGPNDVYSSEHRHGTQEMQVFRFQPSVFEGCKTGA